MEETAPFHERALQRTVLICYWRGDKQYSGCASWEEKRGKVTFQTEQAAPGGGRRRTLVLFTLEPVWKLVPGPGGARAQGNSPPGGWPISQGVCHHLVAGWKGSHPIRILASLYFT
jgi:hypothetical protein